MKREMYGDLKEPYLFIFRQNRCASHLANTSLLAAFSLVARIVEPTQANIVHPPDLRLRGNSNVHTDLRQITKGIVQCDWCKNTVDKGGTSWHSDILGGKWNILAGGRILVETGKCELAVRSSRVTAKCSTVEVEVEAPSSATITTCEICRVSEFLGIRSVGSIDISAANVEIWNELE